MLTSSFSRAQQLPSAGKMASQEEVDKEVTGGVIWDALVCRSISGPHGRACIGTAALTEGAHFVQVGMLLEEMERLGSRNADGKLVCKFGALIKDDRCSNIFEAIVGTLRSAKKKGILTFEGQMLLSPTHDDVDIIVK